MVSALVLVGLGIGGYLLLVDRDSADDTLAEEVDLDAEEAEQHVAELDAALGPARSYDDDQESADDVAASLESLDSDQDVQAQLAPGTREQLEEDNVAVDQALPPGSTVEPRAETWVRRGNVAAMVVDVLAVDGTSDAFLVWLVYDETTNRWGISSTEPVEPGTDQASGDGGPATEVLV